MCYDKRLPLRHRVFVTACRHLAQHYIQYAKSDWPSLKVCRDMRWLSFIYETPLGLVSLYLCSYLQRPNSRFAFCSCDVLLVPRARTEQGERALSLAALSVLELTPTLIVVVFVSNLLYVNCC